MTDGTKEAVERLKLQKTLAQLSHRLSEVEARLNQMTQIQASTSPQARGSIDYDRIIQYNRSNGLC